MSDRSLHDLITLSNWQWALLLQFVFFCKNEAPEETLFRLKMYFQIDVYQRAHKNISFRQLPLFG